MRSSLGGTGTRRPASVLKNLALSCFATLQSAPVYRRIARFAFPRIAIGEASVEDLRKVQEWLSPGREAPPMGPRPDVVHFVAKWRRRIVGFVQLLKREGPEAGPFDGFWLFSIRVWTPMRGLGIGEALVRAVVERAKLEGCGSLHLIVRSDNRPAIVLNRKFGFTERIPERALAEKLAEMGRRDGVPRIVMSRALSRDGAIEQSKGAPVEACEG